ncbi:MAG: hypothetical protein H7A33_00290 [Deltaproteobacteria bacterium]|nr:hypothetical protein [Deltaproteobacteria bacterium]
MVDTLKKTVPFLADAHSAIEDLQSKEQLDQANTQGHELFSADDQYQCGDFTFPTQNYPGPNSVGFVGQKYKALCEPKTSLRIMELAEFIYESNLRNQKAIEHIGKNPALSQGLEKRLDEVRTKLRELEEEIAKDQGNKARFAEFIADAQTTNADIQIKFNAYKGKQREMLMNPKAKDSGQP